MEARTKLLKVVDVQVKYSPRVAEKMGTKGEYHVVKVETEKEATGTDGMGRPIKVKLPSVTTGFTAWKDSPIPGREGVIDFGAELEVGDYFPGDIVARVTEPYFIGSDTGNTFKDGVRGRYVSTAKTLVIGDTADPETFEVAVLTAFKQRGWIIKGSGDAGAPGGNLETAYNRPQTRTVENDVRGQLPREFAEADSDAITGYTANSANREQSQNRQQ